MKRLRTAFKNKCVFFRWFMNYVNLNMFRYEGKMKKDPGAVKEQQNKNNYLLSRRFDPQYKSSSGRSALHGSVYHGLGIV